MIQRNVFQLKNVCRNLGSKKKLPSICLLVLEKVLWDVQHSKNKMDRSLSAFQWEPCRKKLQGMASMTSIICRRVTRSVSMLAWSGIFLITMEACAIWTQIVREQILMILDQAISQLQLISLPKLMLIIDKDLKSQRVAPMQARITLTSVLMIATHRKNNKI